MTPSSDDPLAVHCFLVIIESQSMRILIDNDAQGTQLPSARIPGDKRVASALTAALLQRFGLCTIQLALFSRAGNRDYCAVHEIISCERSVYRNLRFVSLEEASCGQLTSDEFVLVRRMMDGSAHEFGRFAQPGWTNTLVQKSGIQLERTVHPAVQHLNQGIDFCLLSFRDLGGRRLWLKAVGKPNVHEYAVTLELARRFPSFLPRIVAAIPEWNGWVMEDVQGVPLNEASGMRPCEEALAALAFLQQETAPDLTPLVAAGVRDWRIAGIARLIEPLFEEAGQAMQAQTSKLSEPLSNDALKQLKRDIGSAFLEFTNAGLPETLLHGDIGHGNIIATSNGPVFLDWAEASIGHPFICAEHLLADQARSNPLFAERQAALRRHYAFHWKTHLRSSELEKVMALSPAIAAFAYCLFVWDANRGRPDHAQAWPAMRSMLRRTRRELDTASEAIPCFRS